eukprot:gb/GECG01007615.1/.p1 GENE.gb/GECG01007615.1/~~gb/GECG01007615.1/.p1  ORF type:complete len:186 (+),score=44.68 gb/GECG01007615.1/:1-558(+)
MDQQQSTSNIGGSAVAAGIHFEEEDVAHGVASMGDNFGRPQEDASQLQFGEGFDENCAFLSNSEVSWLLEQFQEKGDDKRFSDAFQQSLEYCRRFGGNAEMRTADSTDELRNSLQSLEFRRTDNEGREERKEGLHPYELASLCNLNPGSVEEAKSLIPSLERFTDEDVQAAVEVLKKVASRTIGS